MRMLYARLFVGCCEKIVRHDFRNIFMWNFFHSKRDKNFKALLQVVFFCGVTQKYELTIHNGHSDEIYDELSHRASSFPQFHCIHYIWIIIPYKGAMIWQTYIASGQICCKVNFFFNCKFNLLQLKNILSAIKFTLIRFLNCLKWISILFLLL